MEHQLFFKLNLSQRVLLKWVDREMTELVGATATQIAAILYLMDHDGCQPVDLSRELLQNKSAVTTLTERMEKKGLITKSASATDGRASILHLTEKGKAIGRKAIPYISEYNLELTKGFNTEEVAVIDRFLESIMERFETTPDNYFKNNFLTTKAK